MKINLVFLGVGEAGPGGGQLAVARLGGARVAVARPGLDRVLGGEAFEISTTETLIVVPLFILMGNLAGVSGISKDLYAAAYAWLGHYRGGLASATIGGCAGFAALRAAKLPVLRRVGATRFLPDRPRHLAQYS